MIIIVRHNAINLSVKGNQLKCEPKNDCDSRLEIAGNRFVKTETIKVHHSVIQFNFLSWQVTAVKKCSLFEPTG